MQAYLDSVASPKRRKDAATLVELMERVTGEEPHLSGTVVGFGQYHYRYPSGREGRRGRAAGFAPRKAATTIYVLDGVRAHADLLENFGPHTTGVGCIYIKDPRDVELGVLEAIVARSHATITSGTYSSRARDDCWPTTASPLHVRDKSV